MSDDVSTCRAIGGDLSREAEDFADEDSKVRERVDAKNVFEGYIFSMKSSIEDKDKLGSKLEF